MKQFYRVIKKADSKPVDWNGKECRYTRGAAIKKARAFDGKIEALSEEENGRENLKESLQALRWAFVDVLNTCSDEQEFGGKYPFDKNFREIVDNVIEWVESESNI